MPRSIYGPRQSAIATREGNDDKTSKGPGPARGPLLESASSSKGCSVSDSKTPIPTRRNPERAARHPHLIDKLEPSQQQPQNSSSKTWRCPTIRPEKEETTIIPSTPLKSPSLKACKSSTANIVKTVMKPNLSKMGQQTRKAKRASPISDTEEEEEECEVAAKMKPELQALAVPILVVTSVESCILSKPKMAGGRKANKKGGELSCEPATSAEQVDGMPTSVPPNTPKNQWVRAAAAGERKPEVFPETDMPASPKTPNPKDKLDAPTHQAKGQFSPKQMIDLLQIVRKDLDSVIKDNAKMREEQADNLAKMHQAFLLETAKMRDQHSASQAKAMEIAQQNSELVKKIVDLAAAAGLKPDEKEDDD